MLNSLAKFGAIRPIAGCRMRYIEAMPAHSDNDTRTDVVADMFSSRGASAPLRCKWAKDLVKEMAGFPYGERMARKLRCLGMRRNSAITNESAPGKQSTGFMVHLIMAGELAA